MGRRRGFVATMIREAEKASNRAAADARRQQRQLQAAHIRAVEREIAREQRTLERSIVRAERHLERQRLEAAREHAARTKQADKQAAKDAQIREWKLEFDAHQERDTDIDRIGNDAPEVEDRDQMYASLAVRRVFEPEPFIAPPPHLSHDQANAIQSQFASDMHAALAAFRPDVGTIRKVQGGAGAVAAVGMAALLLSFAGAGLALLLVGLSGVAISQLVATSSSERQRRHAEQQTQGHFEARRLQQLGALQQGDAIRSQQRLAAAQHEYASRTQTAHRQFELVEDERQRALVELQAGSLLRMQQAVEAVADLELPVTCPATVTIESSGNVAIELSLPDRSALPADEAKLLASGKVTYKAKTDKRLKEQYLRLVAGLTLRHASEAMLYLPTCMKVDVRAMLTDLDPATGTHDRRCVLEVSYDYATLAPLTMSDIDPVAALSKFSHHLALERGRTRDIRRAAG